MRINTRKAHEENEWLTASRTLNFGLRNEPPSDARQLVGVATQCLEVACRVVKNRLAEFSNGEEVLQQDGRNQSLSADPEWRRKSAPEATN